MSRRKQWRKQCRNSQPRQPGTKASKVSATLDELEGVVWGEPTFNSYLVTTCHRLRTKPLDEFSAEDFRIMLGQKISLDHLLPRAIALLEQEPLASGDLYPGDLLESVLRCGDWLSSFPQFHARVVVVAECAMAAPEADQKLKSILRGFLREATLGYLARINRSNEPQFAIWLHGKSTLG